MFSTMSVSVRHARKNWKINLILSTATEAGIVCEKCGKPIRTGRFCERCKERMANEFQNAYQKPEPKMENLRSTRDRDRMRYLKNE